jgi:DNA modification methylase
VKTTITVLNTLAREMGMIPPESVDLIVTSPPYPMIEMWDCSFGGEDERIGDCLGAGRGREAFALMHALLDAAWNECSRVLKPGGIACINIGDATRTLGGEFQLYSNHAQILSAFIGRGYAALPDILWRKPTNAPTKFLGSGMLPAGAYVTYEHEYILVLRKGPRRRFTSPEEKALRRESAFFWEERNVWFSDIWEGITGAGQNLSDPGVQKRSAAFPFEIPYRLISMFSIKQDVVLDPFAGAGTTLVAALAAGRSAIGLDKDTSLVEIARNAVLGAKDFANAYTRDRLCRHREFVEARTVAKEPPKYINRHFGFPVMTAQEQDLVLDEVIEVSSNGGRIGVWYRPVDTLDTPRLRSL